MKNIILNDITKCIELEGFLKKEVLNQIISSEKDFLIEMIEYYNSDMEMKIDYVSEPIKFDEYNRYLFGKLGLNDFFLFDDVKDFLFFYKVNPNPLNKSPNELEDVVKFHTLVSKKYDIVYSSKIKSEIKGHLTSDLYCLFFLVPIEDIKYYEISNNKIVARWYMKNFQESFNYASSVINEMQREIGKKFNIKSRREFEKLGFKFSYELNKIEINF